MDDSLKRLSTSITELSRPLVHYTMLIIGFVLVWLAFNDETGRVGSRILQMSAGLAVVYNQVAVRTIIAPLLREIERLSGVVARQKT